MKKLINREPFAEERGFYGHNYTSEQAFAWLGAWQLGRDTLARKMVEYRKALIADGVAPKLAHKLIRISQLELQRAVYREVPAAESFHFMHKPSLDVLIQYGRAEIQGGRYTMRRMGENDTEYYSACGHDDYLGELADAKEEFGSMLLKLARFVRGWAKDPDSAKAQTYRLTVQR
jgi:hypothetical protein